MHQTMYSHERILPKYLSQIHASNYVQSRADITGISVPDTCIKLCSVTSGYYRNICPRYMHQTIFSHERILPEYLSQIHASNYVQSRADITGISVPDTCIKLCTVTSGYYRTICPRYMHQTMFSHERILPDYLYHLTESAGINITRTCVKNSSSKYMY
jgi:hypothetical protein